MYADAATESDREISRWSRPTNRGRDRARQRALALEHAESTLRGTFVHRCLLTREQPARFAGNVAIHPWIDPRSPPVPSDQRELRVDEAPELEVGYWCRTSLAGRGYTSEAVAVVVEHAFDQLGARAIRLRVSEHNLASRRIAERLGFTEVERVSFPASPEWGDAATVLFMMRRAARL